MDRNTVSSGMLGRIIFFSSTTSLALSSLVAQAQGVAMAGKVVSVEGKVLIRQDGGEGAGAPMQPGAQVREGDVINTASNGKAKILLEDKTILDIGSSALFKVQKFEARNGGDRNVDLSMPYGTTRVSVSKPIAAGGKFQIRTRTATMGVRGTEFIVQSELNSGPAPKGEGGKGGKQGGDAPAKAPETKITVIQGKVEVKPQHESASAALPGEARKPAGNLPKNEAPFMLTAGTQLTASADKPTAKPVTLDAGQLSAVSTASKVVDNTFAKAVNLDLSSGSNSSGGNGGGGGNGGNGGNGGSSAGSAAGEATRAAVAQALAAPQNQAPVLPIMFTPVLSTNINAANTPTVPTGGLKYNLTVVVKR